MASSPVLIFAVIGHNTINIPEIFQVFMDFPATLYHAPHLLVWYCDFETVLVMCIIFNFLPCKLSLSPFPPNYSDIPMIV